MTNNDVLRRLRYAFDFTDEKSKHEISAFFRHPDQNQYRVCKDQFLRNVIQGLQMKYRQ